MILKYFTVMFLFLMTSSLNAQDSNQSRIDLNEFLGARLYKVFQTFGTPRDVFCSADGKGEVILDYGIFGLQIGHKEVTIVYFWGNFPGEAFGIKSSMTATEIEKILGKPDDTKISKSDKTPIYIYNMPDTDRMFIIFFDKNNKIDRMQIEWLD